MKKIIISTIVCVTAIWCHGQDFSMSTNLFYALTYPTNICIGTGAMTNGDTYQVWANKINHNEALTWSAAQSNAAALSVHSTTLTANSLILSGLTNGLTTNLQFTDSAVLGGSTNTLYFTNGILMRVTSP